MSKKPNLGQINSPVFSVSQLNDAFRKIDESFENTLSLDGSSPNAMGADLDMNSNSILNVDDVQAQTITVESAIIGGKEFAGTITWRASWLTGTAYEYLDVVNKDGVLYICLESHTSDVFMTDLTNTKWEVFIANTTGPTGDAGADGQGVPVGGTTGQVLAKVDGTDYNTEWVDASGGGSSDHGGLTGLSDDDHTQYHNDTRGDIRYYTKSQVDTSLSGKANTSHTHSIANVTGLQTALDGKQAAGSYAAASHSHIIADVTGLQTALDGKQASGSYAAASHTHTSSEVTDFSEAVDDRVSSLVVAGTNMTITYNDGAGTLTFDAAGGGGGSGDVVGPASATDNAVARFDSTTGKLIQNSPVLIDDNGVLTIPLAPSAPSAPATDNFSLFGRKVGGRMMPAVMGPSGLDTTLQPHLGRNKAALFLPAGNGGADSQVGIVLTATGTATAETVATTNLHSYMRRRSWRVTTASATAVAGLRGGALQWTLGGTAAGLGGFHMVWRWGPATGITVNSSHRAFVGMRGSTNAPTDVNPSTLVNMCGMGYDSADANIQFMHNDGSGTATKIDLGASFAKPSVDLTSVYEIAMFAPPGTTQSLGYEITNLVSGAVATGTITTDIPGTSSLLTPLGYTSVGGISNVIGFATMSFYIEADY